MFEEVVVRLLNRRWGKGAGSRPPGFLGYAENLLGGSSDLLTPEGWLGLGYTHPLTLVIMIIWVIAVASGAVAREVDEGTIEFLASRPVDRRIVLAMRVLLCVAGLLVLLGAAYLGTIVGTFFVADLRTFSRLAGLRLPAALLPLLVAIVGVSFLASVTTSRRSTATAIAIGFAIGSYFLNLAAILWPPLEPLAPLSVFHYLAPTEWLRHGIVWPDAAIPTSVGAIFLFIAHEAFHRRDLAG